MPFGAKYSYRTGRGLFPVVEVDWFDAIRFTNWLHNGAVAGSGTENGAYTIGPPGEFGYPSNASSIARNPGAIWFLPNDDEWYKSAYHENDGATANYFDFPTSSDLAPSSDQPPGASAPNPSNSANFFRNDGIANGYDDGNGMQAQPPRPYYDRDAPQRRGLVTVRDPDDPRDRGRVMNDCDENDAGAGPEDCGPPPDSAPPPRR